MTNIKENIETALADIRLKLLDLTKRNRLLNFRRSKESIFIVDVQPNHVFNRLVSEEKTMIFVPLPEPDKEPTENDTANLFPATLNGEPGKSKREIAREREEEEIRRASLESGINTDIDLPPPSQAKKPKSRKLGEQYLQTRYFSTFLETRLRRVLSTARSVIDETGQNQLYIALGFLEWRESSNSQESFLAPLILIPVSLERGKLEKKTKTFQFSVSYDGEDPFHNLTLAEKLKEDFGLVLPTFDDERAQSTIDGEEVFNPELYFELVQEQVSELKHWRVRRQIVLGFFTFSKLLMYLDLDPQSWAADKQISDHPIIQDLLFGRELAAPDLPSEESIDEDILDSTPIVIDADGSQCVALRKALAGKSLVIEGPPGTGKSQTITNLIGAFLNQGRSVLFVAEKMAALNVVRSNLNKTSLGDFCLELHSHKARKRSVHDDLERRIKARFRDAAKLDSEINKLKNYRESLKDYVELLNSVRGPYGETIFEMFWKVESFRSQLSNRRRWFAIDGVTSLSAASIDDRITLLSELERQLQDLGTPIELPYFGFWPSKLFSGKDNELKGILDECVRSLQHLSSQLDKCFGALSLECSANELTIQDIEALHNLGLGTIPERIDTTLFGTFLFAADDQPWKHLDDFNKLLTSYREKTTSADTTFKPSTEIPVPILHSLRTVLLELTKRVRSEVDIDELTDIGNHAIVVTNELKRVAGFTDFYIKTGCPPPNTVSDLSAIATIHDILHSRPACSGFEPTRESFSDSNMTLLAQLIEEGRDLSRTHKALDTIFALSDLPEKSEIARIRRILRRKLGTFFAIFSSEYREARRNVLGFLNTPELLKSKAILSQLEKLERHLDEKHTFSENRAFRECIGLAFKGIETDWDGLDDSLTWMKRLKSATSSEKLSFKLATDFKQHRDDLADSGELNNCIHNLSSTLKTLSRSVVLSTSEELLTLSLAKLGPHMEAISRLSHEATSLCEPFLITSMVSIQKVLDAIASKMEASEIATHISDDHRFRALCGDSFKGVTTSLEAINDSARWLKTVRTQNLSATVLRSVFREHYYQCLMTFKRESESWLNNRTKYLSSYSRLVQYGAIDEPQCFGGPHTASPLFKVLTKLNCLSDNATSLLKWAEFARLVDMCTSRGLGEVVDLVNRGTISASEVTTAYLHSLYESLIEDLISTHPVLNGFSRAQHEEKRSQFANVDSTVLDLSRERIGYNASRAVPPPGISRGPVREWTEMGLLSKEIGKTTRHIPIRSLLKRAGRAIRALKPCFMMSPMSVAQYLEPGRHEFDVVIMDEASQVKPHEALGAIARGKQIIVVGDPKQLPPTTFFDAISETQDLDGEETTIDDTDSILDLCIGVHFPVERLKWHYRSEHESLIAFSNSQWYDNDLVIFPSPDASKIDLGVKYRYIEGATYSCGRNPKEAEYVAQAVLDHAKRTPHLSLGVGTFNIQQRGLIEDILNQLRKDPANDAAISNLSKANNGNEPFFVKNLENLQGDERDVIFISCTFGPDPEVGKVYQRFGPIIGKNGWRRLNVMFTRAKKRMEVFSSMTPQDIEVGAASSPGAIAFKRFLTYADTGELHEEGTITGHEPGSDPEISIANILKQHGYSIEPQVGVSGYRIDIGVYHPDRDKEFILGVEFDGATYHSAKQARDRDRLREQVLKKRGWNIHRIWSTDWFKNRDIEITRLTNALKSLRERDQHRARKIPPPELTKPTPRAERTREFGEDLRAKLLKYRVDNIPPRDGADVDGVLRNEMIVALVEKRPTNFEEFRIRISETLRNSIWSDERQYLDDILEIIEESYD